jgi:hypothetical protein
MEMAEMVTITAAAKLREKAIDRRMVEGWKQKTTAAPTHVEAPARQESSRGKTHSDDVEALPLEAAAARPAATRFSAKATILPTQGKIVSWRKISVKRLWRHR